MLRDILGLGVTTESAEAVRHLEATVDHFLAHSAETPTHLAACLAADPELVMGHCAKGFFMKLLARNELAPVACQALAQAKAGLETRGGTRRERDYVRALERLVVDDMTGAAEQLDRILDDSPTDALAIKINHGIQFMLGRNYGMRQTLERVLSSWSDDLPCAGYVYGCYAFALEETGDYSKSEEIGRRGVALQPNDVWGSHAVAHVLEMVGDPRGGIRWLAENSGQLKGCNNFAFHVHWHKALFHLELNERDAALELYDQRIRADRTDDFRDIANAASLLFRLEVDGVDIGDRWCELADLAQKHIGDHALVFADTHYLLSLTGAGRHDQARAMIDSMRHFAETSECCEARVARKVGLQLAEAIYRMRAGQPSLAVDRLMPLRKDVQVIGGSHAQRDVFNQLLIEAAIAAGRTDEARQLLAERIDGRPSNSWGWRRMARLLGAIGDQPGLEKANQQLQALPLRAA